MSDHVLVLKHILPPVLSVPGHTKPCSFSTYCDEVKSEIQVSVLDIYLIKAHICTYHA